MTFLLFLFFGGPAIFAALILGQDIISNFIYFLDHSFFMTVFEMAFLFCILVTLKNTFDKYGLRDMKELMQQIRYSIKRKALIDDWYNYSVRERRKLKGGD